MRFDCFEYSSDRSPHCTQLRERNKLARDAYPLCLMMTERMWCNWNIAMIIAVIITLQQLKHEKWRRGHYHSRVSIMPGATLTQTRQVILLWVRLPARTNHPIASSYRKKPAFSPCSTCTKYRNLCNSTSLSDPEEIWVLKGCSLKLKSPVMFSFFYWMSSKEMEKNTNIDLEK